MPGMFYIVIVSHYVCSSEKLRNSQFQLNCWCPWVWLIWCQFWKFHFQNYAATLCSWLTRFCFTRFLLNTVFGNGPNSCLTWLFSPFTRFLFKISVYSPLVRILALHGFPQVTKKALTKNKVYKLIGTVLPNDATKFFFASASKTHDSLKCSFQAFCDVFALTNYAAEIR